MNPFILLLPVLLVAVAVVYGVFRAVGRVWLEHKVRLALLAQLEKNSELASSFQGLKDFVNAVTVSDATPRQDFTLTGALLALIGLGCALWGRNASMGRISAGAYVGGVVCICLGFALALVGVLIRSMTRPLAQDAKGKQPRD